MKPPERITAAATTHLTGAGIVVVGAGAAGISVAAELRAQGYTGRVTVIGEEVELPYDRPPLSKKVLSGTWHTAQAALHSPDWYRSTQIDLITGTRALAIDTGGHLIALDDGRDLPYDQAVIATGLRPRAIGDSDSIGGVHSLRTLADVRALRGAFAVTGRVVIVGAGFLGMEVAAVANQVGLDVTVIDPLPLPMSRGFGPLIGELVGELHRGRGVELLTGVGMKDLITSNGSTPRQVTGVQLDNGRRITTDCVLVAIGSVPNVEWLQGSTIPAAGGVQVDEFLRGAPDVYAAGDVAAWPSRRYGRRLRLEHRTSASEQAAVIGWNLTHPEDLAVFDPIPYFWSEQYDLRLQGHGIFPPEARTEIVSGSVRANRFVARSVLAGQPTGLIGWNSPKQLMDERFSLQVLPVPRPTTRPDTSVWTVEVSC